MKYVLLSLMILAGGCVGLKNETALQAPAGYPHLLWHDEFDSAPLDLTKWSRIGCSMEMRGDWIRCTSSREDLVSFQNGCLVLTGVVNTDKAVDPRPYLQGQVWTQGKFSFQYGKIEIRAKFEDQKGAWPAFWMMPDSYVSGLAKWPDCGEIDIMERLNSDPFVYQTCHSKWNVTMEQKDNPPKSGKGTFRQGEFNVYGLEWTENELIWSVNGVTTHRYPRTNADPAQWPFSNGPFYLLLDMQLGGSWVGEVDPSTLPVNVWIDYVRVWTKAPEASRQKASGKR